MPCGIGIAYPGGGANGGSCGDSSPSGKPDQLVLLVPVLPAFTLPGDGGGDCTGCIGYADGGNCPFCGCPRPIASLGCCPGILGVEEATPSIEAKTLAATALSSIEGISTLGRLGTRIFSPRA